MCSAVLIVTIIRVTRKFLMWQTLTALAKEFRDLFFLCFRHERRDVDGQQNLVIFLKEKNKNNSGSSMSFRVDGANFQLKESETETSRHLLVSLMVIFGHLHVTQVKSGLGYQSSLQMAKSLDCLTSLRNLSTSGMS